MELERRIVSFTLTLVLGLTACAFVMVGGTLSTQDEARLGRDLKAVQAFYQQLEAERFRALEAQMRLLAELPQIKTVMATREAAAISEALESFREMIHADFLEAFDETNAPYGTKNRTDPGTLVGEAQDSGNPRYGYLSDTVTIRQAVAIPVAVSGKSVGTLLAGYRFSDDMLARLQAMTRGELALIGTENGLKIFQATPGAVELLGDQLKAFGSLGSEPKVVVPGKYMATAAASLTGPGGEKIGKLVAIRALSEWKQAADRLRWNMILIAATFCLAAAAVSLLFARSISRPLRGLNERLRDVDPGDLEALQKLAEPRYGEQLGADRDVQAVLASFGELLRALRRERERADEGLARRIGGFEDELDASRKQQHKLTDANKRLLKLLGRGRGAA